MRLYVHMMLCGSVCTLLYLFCSGILPYELPLRWRRFWIRSESGHSVTGDLEKFVEKKNGADYGNE